MCGIFCSLKAGSSRSPGPGLERRLRNRGPDSERTICIVCSKLTTLAHDTSPRDVHVTFFSTVLSLRGSQIVSQPYQDTDRKYVFCWNGEAWSIGDLRTTGSDTEAVHRLLVEAVQSPTPFDKPRKPLASAELVATALSQVSGPYAFVFFDHSRGQLFFGRDFLGRRSLLRRIDREGSLMISSVADDVPEAEWTELEAGRVYCIDINATETAPTSNPLSPSERWGMSIAWHYKVSGQDVTDPTSVIPCLSLSKEVPYFQRPLDETSASVASLQSVLESSLALRVFNIPEPPNFDMKSQSSGLSKIAILFSGGLDCTVLARMSHDLLAVSEPIDLLNVAFENPRIHKSVSSTDSSSQNIYELCPDRVTGRASHAELQRTCPGRTWRFVAINVPYSETLQHRQEVISLMQPHNTEMDLSISYALYFAARGVGYVSIPNGEQELCYATPARVLLSGLGADELFAGYTRHATAFKRGGFSALLDEMQLDVSRIGKRNLGRDDRVMSNWNREVRFPYLDEELLSWALATPITDKCGFGEGELNDTSVHDDRTSLEPGKKVLRCLASKLGMKNVAREKKRAIQFGARTAKMETGKTKGTQLVS